MARSGSGDSYLVKLDTAGRVLVPAGMRERFHMHSGDMLVLKAGRNGLELRTYDQVLGEAQDYFCSKAPADRLLSEELIGDRRREAGRE